MATENRVNIGSGNGLLPGTRVQAKFQNDWKSLNPNLVATRLHEILR